MFKKIALTSLLFYFIASTCLAKTNISSVRIGLHEDKTRLVIELSQKDHFAAVDDHQKSIKIKLHQTDIPHKYMAKQKGKGHITQYYFTPGPKGTTILNIGIQKKTKLKQLFSIQKSKTNPFMIVVDIAPAKDDQKKVASVNKTTYQIPLPHHKPLRKIVVIDAGHGGQDPGTIAATGIQEKNITLAVALQMKKLIDQSGKYTAILTRSGDKHLPLRYRFSVAREMNANLFISLHADSNPNKNIRGISVYTLSEKASDKEAQRLADKENNSDFMEDLKFTQNTDPDVKDILINLSQTRAKNHALDFADTLMKKFKSKEILLKNTHRAADFAVLKAPDVASVLIELGYLSNPTDQKRLVSKQYQVKIARLIVSAINDYFEHVKS